MTKSQQVFGGLVLLAVAYSALHYYLFEVVAWGLHAEGALGAFEFEVVDMGHRLPYVLTPYLIAQAFVLASWTIRPPGHADLQLARVRLSEWLRWSALLGVLFSAGVVVGLLRQQMLAVYFMTLVPLFGVAYTTSVYRCLQLNAHLRAQAMAGPSTRSLALGAFLPSILGLLWPVGFGVPIYVWHRARGLRLGL